ncbi:MAG: flagellar hook-basal body complex protein [candidate division Zixibacteria bacterium]|nr:flagellar hook-basal body complex protein [candidate division Zixibacteria bacterium]
MMGSLYAGVSGLKNHQTKMNVIGNNIANVNTIGFKCGRVNFQEALVQTYKGAGRPSAISGGTNPVQLGLGMQVSAIDNMFLQGGLETTGQITDLAIQGSGFFILGDNYGNKFYTRAGAFGFDADSTLVDPANGLFVLGKMADSSGVIPSLATIGQITLPFGQQDPARGTTEITLANNIDASATDSRASLVNSGNSNIVSVNGTAANGVGGTHVISIVGAQPTNSEATGANVGNDGTGALVGSLGGTMTLGTLGIDDFTNFGFSVDGGPIEYITGMNVNSTVNDVVSSINQIEGITAVLEGGEIRITRTKAGSGTDYNITSTVGNYTAAAGSGATAGNIVGVLFGVNGTSISANSGMATTLAATDVFTPTRGTGIAAGPVTTSLNLVFDETTGLVTGLSGLGGGGVELKAGAGGLAATAGSDLIVNTDLTAHSTSINVYDSQGGRHTLSVEFSKSLIPNRWEWQASTLSSEEITVGRSGYVSFNSDGSLNTFEYNGGASAIVINPNNGANVMEVAVDAGTNSNFDGLTSFASGTHTATIIAQDGYGMGILEKIAIDKSGNISGIFSNGVTRILAQVLLADFNNQAGLLKAGRSLYQTSANSGEAVEGVAGSTISGEITSGALESSSVDIAQEFTSMITTQRGFQANARIITTSDEMLDQLVNLKR